jgi:hypothetical protein
MSVRLKTLIALVALPVLLAPPASSLAAKTKPDTFVQAPSRRVEFKLGGTKGWRIELSANIPAADAKKKNPLNVAVLASRGNADVQYSTHGHVGADGAIDAVLPGVGRVEVNFEPTELTREALADNCRGRAAKIHHGFFRGTIELHGEQAYTSVERPRQADRIVPPGLQQRWRLPGIRPRRSPHGENAPLRSRARPADPFHVGHRV